MVAADGSQRSLAFYPFRNFTMFNFIMLVPDELLKDPVSESKNEIRIADDALEYFHDFPEGIKALCRSAFGGPWSFGNWFTPKLTTKIRLWQIQHEDPLPTYMMGRAIIIGDAAHTMTPTRSQGANQAIEDAESLQLLNADGVSRDNLHAVVDQWVG